MQTSRTVTGLVLATKSPPPASTVWATGLILEISRIECQKNQRIWEFAEKWEAVRGYLLISSHMTAPLPATLRYLSAQLARNAGLRSRCFPNQTVRPQKSRISGKIGDCQRKAADVLRNNSPSVGCNDVLVHSAMQNADFHFPSFDEKDRN